MTLLEIVSKPSQCENVVEMLQWFEMSTFFMLVRERPNPCMDLSEFCKCNNCRLPEAVAQRIISQVGEGAGHSCGLSVPQQDNKHTQISIKRDA